MPEFWECCNKRSIPILVVLYAEENGKLPPWYDDLKVRPSINIESETYRYEQEEMVKHEMQQPPSNRLNREGE